MRFAALMAAFLLVPALAWAEPVPVRLVAVVDGDHVIVERKDSEVLQIRLLEIDAPEAAQPWGAEAKHILTAMLVGQPLLLQAGGLDRYGDTMGRITANGRDASDEMVREGAAWAFEHLLASDATKALEAEARAAKRGLWAQPKDDIMPPWEWRQAHYDPQ